MNETDSPQADKTSLRWLSILPVLNAIVPLWAGFMLLSGGSELSEAAGSSMAYLLIGSAFQGLLGLITGVGIWIGKRWGWWLATYYFIYIGLRSLNHLISSLVAGQAGSTPSRDLLNLVLGLGVAIYLYTPGALGWFGMSLRRKWPSALLLFAAVIGTVLFFLALALVM